MEPSDSSAIPPSLFFERSRQRRFWGWKCVIAVLFLCCIGILALAARWSAPPNFPVGESVTITRGMPLVKIALSLKEQDFVRSPFWFKAWGVLLGGGKGVKAGEYHFSEPLSVFALAKRLTSGEQHLPVVRIVVPEGLSNAQVAGILSKNLKEFDRDRFLALAKRKEGYLFPDTYTFFQNTTEEEVIAEMAKNFEERLAPFTAAIADFLPAQAGGKPLHSVLTMASLVEGEARTNETRRQISDILWRRLERGMPLQVDAVFPYILGKNTYEVTSEDLKTDSPYNTYANTGLPPGPINNPSLDAIDAVIRPIPSAYLYYLSDKNGVMHYAVTHQEHLINRAKYLQK